MLFRLSVFFCAVFLVLGLPFYSEAGILSMMGSVFSSSSEQNATNTVVENQNTQKMDLLEAATNSDPVPQKIDANVSLVGGAALTNENSSIGPEITENAYYKQSSDRINLYTVRKGDTLSQIADMYGVSASTILWANDMKRGSTVTIGQVLVILPVSGVKYTIKKGDTVKSIAKKYDANVEDINEYNNLEDGTALAVGDELIIPDGVLHENTENTSKTIAKKAGGIAASLFGGNSSKKYNIDTSGYFKRPVNGGVRTQGIHGHNGIDIAASHGTPIYAAAGGQVIISKSGGWGGGYGTYVVIQHSNGTQTLYGHLSKTEVTVGETVDKGEVIGKMGNTGQSSGVHLHFEVRGGVNPF